MRVLDSRDEAALRSLISRNSELNVFVSSRVDAGALRMPARAGEIWGFFNGEALVSALLVGPNIVPVELRPEAAVDFGNALSEKTSAFSSVVGPRDAVKLLWPQIESNIGPVRILRETQPYMVLRKNLATPDEPKLRKATLSDLDSYYEASLDMFRNEVQLDPVAVGASAYRSRVMESIKAGKSYGWFDDHGNTLFKIDVGAVSHGACQLQGVWLSHHLRGQGLSTSLIAEAVAMMQSEIAPTVCLYVNDFNRAAIRAYEKVGFETIGEFSTVFL